MFEHFTTPEQIFLYKLGMALAMEFEAMELHTDLDNAAKRSGVRELVQAQAKENRGHIAKLKECFAMLGREPHQFSSPTSKALGREARSFIGKVDSALVDEVVLTSLLEARHHECGVYESLAIHAKVEGAPGVAELLNQCLAEEQDAIAGVRAAVTDLAGADVAAAQETAGGNTDTSGKGPDFGIAQLPRAGN